MALKDDLAAAAQAAEKRARTQGRNPRREEMINNFTQRALTEQARSRTPIKSPRGLERRRKTGAPPSSMPRYLH